MQGLLQRYPALRILSGEKSFSDPWVCDPQLNQWGLHPARVALSNATTAIRRLLAGARREPAVRTMLRDGVVVVPNLLPPARFARLKDEIEARVGEVERTHPIRTSGDRGFGPKRPFEGGFDRWDGDTLNRFIHPDADLRETCSVGRHLLRIAGLAIGAKPGIDKLWIYQTVHGEDADNHDVQKDLHRDTFHSAVKLWYFLRDVDREHGPFTYVKGSHRMSMARHRWEYRRALHCCEQRVPGGSFRINEERLAELNLPAPEAIPVRANTLVMADVRGFHRRADARAGARRLALYAGVRPNPFLPIPR
jgi:hypothetical protein